MRSMFPPLTLTWDSSLALKFYYRTGTAAAAPPLFPPPDFSTLPPRNVYSIWKFVESD